MAALPTLLALLFGPDPASGRGLRAQRAHVKIKISKRSRTEPDGAARVDDSAACSRGAITALDSLHLECRRKSGFDCAQPHASPLSQPPPALWARCSLLRPALAGWLACGERTASGTSSSDRRFAACGSQVERGKGEDYQDCKDCRDCKEDYNLASDEDCRAGEAGEGQAQDMPTWTFCEKAAMAATPGPQSPQAQEPQVQREEEEVLCSRM